MTWGSPVERERRNRIRLSVAAYAYEFRDDPIMDDSTFDELSEEINPGKSTDHPVLDAFFHKKFNPCTGQWIHDHPDLAGIKHLYEKVYRNG